MAQVNITKHTIDTLTPLKDTILVSDMAFGERKTLSGVIILDDDMKNEGIRGRWGKVFALGPDINWLTEGQWIYVAHGRWSRGQTIITDGEEKIIRKIDPKEVLLVSDEPMVDETLSNKA